MSLVDTELVLVVPTARFHELGYFQGFTDQVERYVDALLDPDHVSYRPRAEMEQDPSFKQLIPYVIFRYPAPDGVQLFQYTRGSGQGEARLHAMRSIGVGGHICVEDAQDAAGVYEEGMRRELNEEVQIDAPCRERCVGLINDDETEVGRVHLGVVHIFDVERPDVTPRENDLCDARFVPLNELLAAIDSFESWSQISLRSLFQ